MRLTRRSFLRAASGGLLALLPASLARSKTEPEMVISGFPTSGQRGQSIDPIQVFESGFPPSIVSTEAWKADQRAQNVLLQDHLDDMVRDIFKHKPPTQVPVGHTQAEILRRARRAR